MFISRQGHEASLHEGLTLKIAASGPAGARARLLINVMTRELIRPIAAQFGLDKPLTTRFAVRPWIDTQGPPGCPKR